MRPRAQISIFLGVGSGWVEGVAALDEKASKPHLVPGTGAKKAAIPGAGPDPRSLLGPGPRLTGHMVHVMGIRYQ